MKKGNLIKRIVIAIVMLGIASFAFYMMFIRKVTPVEDLHAACDHYDENGHCIGVDGIDYTQLKIDKMKAGSDELASKQEKIEAGSEELAEKQAKSTVYTPSGKQVKLGG